MNKLTDYKNLMEQYKKQSSIDDSDPVSDSKFSDDSSDDVDLTDAVLSDPSFSQQTTPPAAAQPASAQPASTESVNPADYIQKPAEIKSSYQDLLSQYAQANQQAQQNLQSAKDARFGTDIAGAVGQLGRDISMAPTGKQATSIIPEVSKMGERAVTDAQAANTANLTNIGTKFSLQKEQSKEISAAANEARKADLEGMQANMIRSKIQLSGNDNDPKSEASKQAADAAQKLYSDYADMFVGKSAAQVSDLMDKVQAKIKSDATSSEAEARLKEAQAMHAQSADFKNERIKMANDAQTTKQQNLMNTESEKLGKQISASKLDVAVDAFKRLDDLYKSQGAEYSIDNPPPGLSGAITGTGSFTKAMPDWMTSEDGMKFKAIKSDLRSAMLGMSGSARVSKENLGLIDDRLGISGTKNFNDVTRNIANLKNEVYSKLKTIENSAPPAVLDNYKSKSGSIHSGLIPDAPGSQQSNPTINPKVQLFMSKNPDVKTPEEATQILKQYGKL